MRQERRHVNRAARHQIQGRAGGFQPRLEPRARDGGGGAVLAEEHLVVEGEAIRTRDAEEEDVAVSFDQGRGQVDRSLLARGLDHDIGHLSAGDLGHGLDRVIGCVAERVGGAEPRRNGRPMRHDIQRDDPRRAQPAAHRGEKQPGRPQADDRDILVDEARQPLAGKDHRAKLLGHQQMLVPPGGRAGRQNQHMLDRRQEVLGHRRVVGRHRQRDIARLQATTRRIHRLHDPDHLVARRAPREGVALRRLVIDHVDIAAAERDQPRLHQGIPRLEFGLRRFDETRLTGRDTLNCTHHAFDPPRRNGSVPDGRCLPRMISSTFGIATVYAQYAARWVG